MTLIPDHSIGSTICNVEILERKGASIVFIEQNLEVVIVVRLLVVRCIVLKCEDSGWRSAINFIVDALGGSLVNVEICPEGH